MLVLVLAGTVYFVLLDELVIGNTQRRKGPLNLGSYGFLSSVVNGFNLMVSQLVLPKVHIHYFLSC